MRHDAPEDDPPTEHDQRFWLGELTLSAIVGLSDRLAIHAQAPFRWTRSAVDFRRLDGEPLDPEYESVHHRDETLRGPGDPRVGGRRRFVAGGIAGTVELGLTVPLGRTEPNPFALGAAGKRHQHLQFGTGTFDPFVEIDLSRRDGTVAVGARAEARLPWTENEHGYRAGRRWSGGLRTVFPPRRGIEATARLDLHREEPERWGGRVPGEGNLGRTDLLLGGSVSIPRGPYRASIGLAVPLWRRVAGAQVEWPAIVTVGVTRAIGPGGILRAEE